MIAATSVTTKFNVSGILLDRPFKIRRLGHFAFNISDLDKAYHFYSDLLDFSVSDEFARGGWLCASERTITRRSASNQPTTPLRRLLANGDTGSLISPSIRSPGRRKPERTGQRR